MLPIVNSVVILSLARGTSCTRGSVAIASTAASRRASQSGESVGDPASAVPLSSVVRNSAAVHARGRGRRSLVVFDRAPCMIPLRSTFDLRCAGRPAAVAILSGAVVIGLARTALSIAGLARALAAVLA